MSKAGIAAIVIAATLFGGCSVRMMAVRSMGPVIDGGFKAMMAEDDLPLARSALESNLKLIEGLILSDPKNDRMLLLAAQGFTSYALAFVEDENPKRARRLYLRGRDYASRWLESRHDVGLVAIDRLDDFDRAVASLPGDAVPGVFWLGNAWASALMLSLDDVAAISELPKVEWLMRFVLDEDESYYFAGAHLFFGGYYGSRPKALGGNPEKAKAHLDRHRELTGGKFLLGEFFRVKYLHLPALDEQAARAALEKIISFDLDDAPGERLINRVAQEKARRLLANIDEYL